MFRTTLATASVIALLSAPALADNHNADIVETAVAAGDFTTLVAAVEAAGLVETLQGEGPFTVFAPTDSAFGALPEGTVEGLLEDIPTLTSILTYHVVAGDYSAEQLTDGMMLETVQGQSLVVSGVGTPQINNATVSATNIRASNGVIHVIDAVLMPE